MKEFEDAEITKIKCASCGKRLINILHLNKDQNLVNRVQATCPFCINGNSIVHEIVGLFASGPVGADESSSPTLIDDIHFDPDTKNSQFIIKKDKK